jgi:hypothetical protein
MRINDRGTGFEPQGLLREYPLILSAGSGQIIRGPARKLISSVIVSVQFGRLDLFRGEAQSGVPWRCVPEIVYQWFLPPSDQYVFWVQAVDDLEASVILLGS